MRRAVLLRHGLTQANEARLYCGASDLTLSERGREELRRLQSVYRYPDCSTLRVFTSGMKRTEETLSLLYGDVPHFQHTGFREIHFGRFEMQSYKSLCQDPAYLKWISGENEKNRCPGGESGEEMKQRVLDAFRTVLRGGNALIVTHGGPICAIMSELFPGEHRTRYQWQPPAGRGYSVLMTDRLCGVSWETCPAEISPAPAGT